MRASRLPIIRKKPPEKTRASVDIVLFFSHFVRSDSHRRFLSLPSQPDARREDAPGRLTNNNNK